MAKFKNEKGLTLIELLITIAVLAVVSAIALPVINNVVSSSNSNALVQTQNDVADFVAKYNAAGAVSFDGTTFQGYVDADGDNVVDSNELVDTLTLDSKFTAGVPAMVAFSASYASDATAPTVSLASASTGTPAAPSYAYTLTSTDIGSGSCNVSAWAGLPNNFRFFCMFTPNATDALNSLAPGDTFEVTIDGTNYTYTVASVTVSGTPEIIVQEATVAPGYITGYRM